jgi:hypothetical protein
MADVYGNYEIGLSVLAGLSLLGSFCFVAATPPEPRMVTTAAT